MNYLWVCLRDCFVYNRFHNEGQTYELQDNLEISPKNFRLVEEALPQALEQVTEVVKEEVSIIPTENNLKCPVCGKECKSLFGLSVHQRIHKKGG